ncbi:MAG: hypothetical protein JWQ35_643 [Bacteriovoracaceae bacterium]|nr:hypothetical protein [Bacteriovoracaceae bacterium]
MNPIIYQWINIIILFSFLGIVLKKKLGAYFAAERNKLDTEMRTAGAEYHRIKDEFSTIQKSVNELDKKITELKNLSLKEIENESKRIESETANALEKISIDGEARIKNEADRTKKALEKELFQSALALAKESLAKELKEQNQDWISQMVQGEPTGKKKNYAS